MSSLRSRFVAHESRWCLHANRTCARDAVRTYFALVSRLGDGIFWYVLMAALALFGGLPGLKAAGQMAVAGGGALLLYKRLKHTTRRPRPFAADLRIRAWVAPLDEFSFPSGHTLHAVTFSAIALTYFPWLAWLLVPFAASVAVSRIVLGLHYPSDVLAAALLGGVLSAASFALAGWIFPH